MLPPPLLMVEAPAMVTGVAKIIASLVVVRSTPMLVSPPVPLTVKALKVEVAVIKSIVPVPCAFKDNTPVMFWL